MIYIETFTCGDDKKSTNMKMVGTFELVQIIKYYLIILFIMLNQTISLKLSVFS